MTEPVHKEKCSLLLCPGDHNFQLENNETLIKLLQKIGFIAQPINISNNTQPVFSEYRHYFYTGERYLDFINYLGCAPTIQFEASEDTGLENEDFCFIKLHFYDTATLLHDDKLKRKPLCPLCNKPADNWQQEITATTITCDKCLRTSVIETYNWRKFAGFACLFIEITDIFPKEATPQPALLNLLEADTGIPWQYFYRCR